MAHRIQQILFRSAMRVMTGNTGSRPWFFAIVGRGKLGGILIVTLRTERADGFFDQSGVVAAMRAMAGGAVLAGRLMHRAVTPVLGHRAMTAKTKSRLGFFQVVGMSGAMTVVAGSALLFRHRFVLDLVLCDRCFGLVVAFETGLTGFPFDQLAMLGAMRRVAGQAVAIGKGLMGVFFRFAAGQIFMAGEAELTPAGAVPEQLALFAAMGIMTCAAFPSPERFVQAELPHFSLGLLVTREAEF